jgi:hypothetical protein
MTTQTTVKPALTDRVRAGNEKFNEQWARAREAAGDPERWGRLMEQLAAAWPKLHAMCQQLMLGEGYRSCLYPGGEHRCDEKDGVCFVCPKGVKQ